MKRSASAACCGCSRGASRRSSRSDCRRSARGISGDARAPRRPARATAWLWWQSLRLALTFRWERAAHGRPLPPIADELRGLGHMWDGLRQDIHFGVRMLRRQPGFTAVALLALALGIGANTAIFSIVDAVLWRPLPYPASETVISIGEQRPQENRARSGGARRFLRLATRQPRVRRDVGDRGRSRQHQRRRRARAGARPRP